MRTRTARIEIFWLLFILFLGFVSTFGYAAKRRPTAFLSEEMWASTFPKAISQGTIHYFLRADRNLPNDNISHDFEVALYVWLKSIGLNSVKVERTYFKEKSDIYVRFSKRFSYQDRIFYTTVDEPRWKSHGFPVITFTTDIEGISIRDGLKSEAIVTARARSSSVPTKISIREVFGDGGTSEEVALHILGSSQLLGHDANVQVAGNWVEFYYPLLLHELGHAFGLSDLYKSKEIPYAEPKYASVMKCAKWWPLTPTRIDIRRAKKHLTESKWCQGLLMPSLDKL